MVKLLDKVHDNEELNAVLNDPDNCPPLAQHHNKLTRLSLAIDYKEKKVCGVNILSAKALCGHCVKSPLTVRIFMAHSP